MKPVQAELKENSVELKNGSVVTKINRGEIAALSAIIGKCAIKSIGSDLFIPIIKLKAEASASVTKSQDLLKSIREEFGITQENYRFVSEGLLKEFAESEKKLNEDPVDFTDTRLLTADLFLAFSDENPKLIAAELEFIYKWMVKPE